MSYILEALKKSQEERELGRVPTLDTSLFPVRDDSVRVHPWGLLAVGLATLAVVIALYAALRAQAPAPAPVQGPPAAAQAAVSAVPEPAVPAVAAAPEPEPAAYPEAREYEAPGDEDEPAPAAGRAAPKASAPPAPRAAAAQPRPPPRRSSVDAAIPPRPQRTPVPDDVRADIEAFKQEVLGVDAPPPPPPPAQRNVPPEQLRLSREMEARLPAFLMTVHVYDEDPEKRFVLINALKTVEGERSREGIVVEEIRPGGAVLSFEGHRFYRAR